MLVALASKNARAIQRHRGSENQNLPKPNDVRDRTWTLNVRVVISGGSFIKRVVDQLILEDIREVEAADSCARGGIDAGALRCVREARASSVLISS
jgi:hypothetical protein